MILIMYKMCNTIRQHGLTQFTNINCNESLSAKPSISCAQCQGNVSVVLSKWSQGYKERIV